MMMTICIMLLYAYCELCVYETGPMEQALDLPQEMTQWSEARRHHSKSRRKSDCNKHKPKSMRCVRAEKRYNLLFTNSITLCILGGGYYEDKRDESTGQGSKTLRTRWQSRLKSF